jgi:hypothetical protein
MIVFDVSSRSRMLRVDVAQPNSTSGQGEDDVGEVGQPTNPCPPLLGLVILSFSKDLLFKGHVLRMIYLLCMYKRLLLSLSGIGI